MDERIFMLECGERTDSPGLDRIGGLPPSLGGKRWPLTEDGEPMVHLISMEIAGRKAAPKGKRGVSVFVKSLSDIDRFDEGDDDPRDVVVRSWTTEDLARPAPKPPAETPVLSCHALEVQPWLEVKASAERIQLLYEGKVLGRRARISTELRGRRLSRYLRERRLGRAVAHASLPRRAGWCQVTCMVGCRSTPGLPWRRTFERCRSDIP